MSDLFSHFTSIAFAPYQRLGDKTTRDWGRRVETRCSFISDARHGLIDLRVQFRGETGCLTRHFTIRLFGASRGSCAPSPSHYVHRPSPPGRVLGLRFLHFDATSGNSSRLNSPTIPNPAISPGSTRPPKNIQSSQFTHVFGQMTLSTETLS